MLEYTNDYLLDQKIKILQPCNGYRASSDAVLLSAMPANVEKTQQILDVGSGTGAISLSLAYRLKQNYGQIKGVEIQKNLVELSQYSAALNNFLRVHFYQEDIRNKLQNMDLSPCSFDVVITNPPYSDHDMPSPNVSKATAHNHADFSLTDWLNFCLKMTKPYGYIYLINRTEALPEICSAMAGKAGNLTVIPVYSKSEQNSKRILVKMQKDSKAPCRILPPFYTHAAGGDYTAAAQDILRQGKSFAELGYAV